MSGKRFLRCSVLAVASVAMLVLPSAASAHETGDHAPATAACPPGGPTQNAVCFALRGLEYSVRHGGTVGAANELRTNTETNVGTYAGSASGAVQTYKNDVGAAGTAFQTTMVSAGTAFATQFEAATNDLQLAIDAGLINALTDSDGYGAATLTKTQEFLAQPPQILQCPLDSAPSVPLFPQTIGALKALFCAQWAALVKVPSTNIAGIKAHVETLPAVLGGISQDFEDGLNAFAGALEASGNQLAGTTAQATIDLEGAVQTATETAAGAVAAATEAAGANQVFHTFYAAQCVRKGDYGPFARPTVCPQ